MAALVDGDRTLTVLGGFAGWFPASEAAAPRWKQALAVVSGLIPVSLAVSILRVALVPDVPLGAAVVITSVCNVAVLTWLVMPLLTRILQSWLTS